MTDVDHGTGIADAICDAPADSKLSREQLKGVCLNFYKERPPYSSLKQYCRDKRISPHYNSVNHFFTVSGLRDLHQANVEFGPRVLDMLQQYLQERDTKKRPETKAAGRLTKEELRTHCIAVYQLLPNDGVLLPYCKQHDIVSHRMAIQRAMVASGLKQFKDDNVPYSEEVEKALDDYLNKRGKHIVTAKNKPFAKQTRKTSPKKRTVAKKASKPAAAERPQSPVKHLTNSEVRRHCLELYKLPLSGAVMGYCKKHDIVSSRHTLRRAMQASGLRKLQEQGIPHNSPAVLEALDKFVQARQSKREAASDKRKEKKTLPMPRDLFKFYVCDYYQQKDGISVHEYCIGKKIANHYNDSLSQAFVESGLKSMREKKVPFGSKILKTMDAYLDKNPKSLSRTVDLDGSKKPKAARSGSKQGEADAQVNAQANQPKKLSRESLKYHCCDFYHAQGMTLKAYCEQKGLTSRQSRTLGRALRSSGLNVMKRDKVPFGTIVVNKLDKYLDGKNKTILTVKETAGEESSPEKKQLVGFNREQIQEHCYALYNLPDGTVMGYCKQKNLFAQRNTLQRVFTASGLKKMKASGVPFGSDVENAMTRYLEGRKRFLHGKRSNAPATISDAVTNSLQGDSMNTNKRRRRW